MTSKVRAYVEALLRVARLLFPLTGEPAAQRLDLRRRLRGHCCDKPDGRGGYAHWWCQKNRAHPGPHRFINYSWPRGGGVVEYSPVDVPPTVAADLRPAGSFSRTYVQRVRGMSWREAWAKANYMARHQST